VNITLKQKMFTEKFFDFSGNFSIWFYRFKILPPYKAVTETNRKEEKVKLYCSLKLFI